MNNFDNEESFFVQNIGSKEGAISPSITNSAAFAYATPEIAEGIFNGSIKKPLYARMGNPTTAKLESILASMDGGVGAIATSSGMGAISLATLSLLSSGDEVISIGGLFGGTYSYFSETIARFGISATFFDVDEFEEIESAINEKTKIIFLESVGNPNLHLPDIKRLAALADKHQVALIVDNTITPLSVKPLSLGADIVVYSTTKVISGNSSALGGCAVFRAINEKSDKFKTSRYAFLEKFIQNAGKMALIPNAKKRALRDFGMSANAQASYLTMLGLETLPLRAQRVNESIVIIAKALEENGIDVNHPSLPNNSYNSLFQNEYKGGCGTFLTIDMQTKERAFEFLSKSKIATITANIGDNRTLALHMASTIYRDFDAKTKEFLGITEGLIRISIGLENPQDIINDFLQAAQ